LQRFRFELFEKWMRISFAALLAIPVPIVASPSAASEERGFYIGGALGRQRSQMVRFVVARPQL